MRMSQNRFQKRSTSRKGSPYKKSLSPDRSSGPFHSALQAEQVEKAIQYGVHMEESLQFYFLEERHDKLTAQERGRITADEIRRTYKENKKQDRKVMNMIEQLCMKKGYNMKLNTFWAQYSHLQIPFVIDTNVLITKDRNRWEDFFKRFNKQDLTDVPNQNISENIEKINKKNKQQIVSNLRQYIKGKLIIHQQQQMIFPDNAPIIMEGTGLTHHIILEYGVDGIVPHRLMFIRKELYTQLGQYYTLQDSEKNKINMIQWGYSHYFKRLDQIEGRQQQYLQEEDIEHSESYYNELEILIKEKEVQEIGEEQYNQDIIEHKPQVKPVEVFDNTPRPNPKIKLKKKEEQSSRSRSREKIQTPLQLSYNPPVVEEQSKFNPQDYIINYKEGVIVPQSLNEMLLKGYVFKKQMEQNKQTIGQYIRMEGFKPVKIQQQKVQYEIRSPLTWYYGGLLVDFIYYMASQERTGSWRYLTDHWSSIWMASYLIQSKNIELERNEFQQFRKKDWIKVQHSYDMEQDLKWIQQTELENPKLRLLKKTEMMNEIKERENELEQNIKYIIIDSYFYEHSHLYVVSKLYKDQSRGIQFLFREITELEQYKGYVVALTHRDTQIKIEWLIMNKFIDPGATPLMAYKLSEFNVNPLTGRVSSTLQTLIKQQAEYTETTPYDQILHWIELAQSLGQ